MGKVIQMLSPENYIRQKARKLPIFECLVNKDWDTTQIANLIVARQHTNGNVTAGVYLVDLACLGVKDTAWFFNITETDYRNKIDQFFEMDGGAVHIDYITAHNIVHAGIEFAEEYEFKPHKDFKSITQYILDEDTEDIPIIEIECGIDGLPAYMPGPLHNDAKAKQVIAQLERVAGPGNYYQINEDGMVMNDEDEDTDEFSHLSYEEKRELFLTRNEKFDQFTDDELDDFFKLLNSLNNDLIDQDKCELIYDELFDGVTQVEVDEEEIPDELLGAEHGTFSEEVKKQFVEILESIANPKISKELYKSFSKNSGTDAATALIDLVICALDHPKKYKQRLDETIKKYPNYSLLQIRKLKNEIGGEGFEPTLGYKQKLMNLLNERDTLHPFEFFLYLDLITHFILAEKDAIQLEAWKRVIIDLDIDEGDQAVLLSLIMMFQIGILVSYFENEK